MYDPLNNTPVKKKQINKRSLKYKDSIIYALDCAAEFLQNEEWPVPEEKQEMREAYKDASKLIEILADNYYNKHFVKKVKLKKDKGKIKL